ncbi:hypothetical protein [Cohnella hashimotonis]|uniref:Uncharacterized protein n=1 Tax=Cohnella hashimotonis TaxID=2826895 RepID=A0ABT6TJT1_9BACL|nr:hypothetical protein [Cohnella hashimotonis]MDI4646107.1 hypothetical protein [Cohnella hashimotonis]
MRSLLDLIGYLILLGGTIVGFASNSVTMVVLSLFGGPVLLGLSHLIGIAENVQARLLDLPPTLATVRSRIRNAPEYAVDGGGIEIYPSAEAKYEWIDLNGDIYIRSRAFRKYLEHVDNRYAFALPGSRTVVLHRAEYYSGGAALFSLDGHSYVLLRAIGLAASLEEDRIALRSLQHGEDTEKS